MKTYGELDVLLHTVLTSELDLMSDQLHFLTALFPG
jgi:hypothetical protein